MVCDVSQKDIYDWILAIAPIVISTSVAVIGYQQYKINRHKLKLDLYNRRFAVYEKSLKYFLNYYSETASQEEIENSSEEFVKAYRESIFLFGENSKVYSVLTELKDTLNFLFHYDKQRKNNLDKSSMAALTKVKEEKGDPHQIMYSLEKALKTWLNFNEIE